MPRFTLKQYRRENPNFTVGTLRQEWLLEAPDVGAAIGIATGEVLKGHKFPTDFAVLWDEDGEMVWSDVRDA